MKPAYEWAVKLSANWENYGRSLNSIERMVGDIQDDAHGIATLFYDYASAAEDAHKKIGLGYTMIIQTVDLPTTPPMEAPRG